MNARDLLQGAAVRVASVVARRPIDRLSARLPLVLISEIQRSGGTLLSQLLDGHPDVLAHPAEIEIGYPKKWDWLSNVAPGDRFLLEKLSQRDLCFRRGYSKGSDVVLPFHFSLPIYARTLADGIRRSRTNADLLEAALSAVFTAWLDYRDRDAFARKQFVSGFTPRVLMHPRAVESLFETSPNAKVITIIRDPRSWYASAKRHTREYRDLDDALQLWTLSARSSIALQKARPDACKVIYFSELTQDPESTMRQLAAFVGLAWSDTLLSPTFNGWPVSSNSKHGRSSAGVIDSSVADRWRDQLRADEVSKIETYVNFSTEFGHLLNLRL